MTTAEPPLGRCAIVGFGPIGRRLASRLIADEGLPGLAGVLVRPGQAEDAAALVGSARVYASLDALLAARPTITVECASALALTALGPDVLASGSDLMPLSLAAMADRRFEEALTRAARNGPGRLEIPAGALGSIGFLAAAKEDELSAVTVRASYPPARWRGTAAETMVDLGAVTMRTCFLRASVREAAARFPRRINVAVGAALAGLGLDRTRIELYADPALTQAAFDIEADARAGAIMLRVAPSKAPAGRDPVDLTTFSILRMLRNRTARVAA